MTTDPTPTLSDADREELHRLHSLNIEFRDCPICHHNEPTVAALIARERKSARDQALDEAAAAIVAEVGSQKEDGATEMWLGGQYWAAHVVRALKST